MKNLNSNEVKNEPTKEMTEKELQAEFEDKNESDSWGLITRPGIGKRIAEQKRIASIKSQEEPLVVEIKKHNAELRCWIKWAGIFTTVLLTVLILVGVKNRNTESWLIVIVLTAGLLLLAKYDSLKKRGILKCKNCGEDFVLKENNFDKKCPYCGQGHTAAYL